MNFFEFNWVSSWRVEKLSSTQTNPNWVSSWRVNFCFSSRTVLLLSLILTSQFLFVPRLRLHLFSVLCCIISFSWFVSLYLSLILLSISMAILTGLSSFWFRLLVVSFFLWEMCIYWGKGRESFVYICSTIFISLIEKFTPNRGF